MTTETKTQSTVAAFSRIVKVLRTVSPGKRPALLDLAMREVAEAPCGCHGQPANAIPPAEPATEQGSLL